ncbi:hypothetical protein HDU87_005108 [Geranomyces variabilis]|uniref:Xrn1 N-terminal domain-containing protein n=1 Tax=Geranomyces variabilis TaxID=109894 RepID=A0AAD5TR69_9FUNG|nr:hypothetical protein HDU87_005108 [Geranomyces variabilis]
MGIKGLAKWLQAKWPAAFAPKADLASLDDLVMRGVNPRSVVCLAVDGPGPLAKIAEQRRRRKAPKIGKRSTFDARQITPGTAFMNSIDSNLNYYACQYLVRTARTKPGLRVVVSGPNVAGEGEVKILGHLVDGRDRFTNLIIGSDNDILLQVIAANVKGTVVLDDDGGVTFSYDDFLVAISRERPASKPELVALDLAAVILMMGNDYLPKLRKATFDKLWSSYKRAAGQYPGRHLVDLNRESFDPAFMKAIVKGIGPRFDWRDPAPNGSRPSSSNHDADLAVDNDSENEAVMDADGANPNRWEINMTPAARRNQSERFLEGIVWCLEMCVNRNCPDYTYEYPFFTAPAPGDLVEFLDEMIADRATIKLSWPRSTSMAVHPVICAAMLLGTDGTAFMDPSWQSLMGLEADRLQVQFTEIMRQPALCSAHMSDAGFGRPIELRTIRSRNADKYMPILPPFATQTFRTLFYRDVLAPTSDHLEKRKTWADRFSGVTEASVTEASEPAATALPAEKKRKVNPAHAKMEITSPVARTQPPAARKPDTGHVKMDLDIVSPVAPTQPQIARPKPPNFSKRSYCCISATTIAFAAADYEADGLSTTDKKSPSNATARFAAAAKAS